MFQGVLYKHRHIFTHKIWEMTGVLMELTQTPKLGENEVLASLSKIREKYSVPSAFSPFLTEIEKFFVHKKFTI